MKRTAEETKQLIFIAALKHFSEMGYDGARMDKLAKSLKLNKATIYYHYKDKHGLYEEIFDTSITDIIKNVTLNTKNIENSVEKLQAYIKTMVTYVYLNRELSKIMLREVIGGGVQVSLPIKEKLGQVLQLVVGIIKKGQNEGVFIETDPLFVHMSVVGTLNLYLGAKDIGIAKTMFTTKEALEAHIQKLILGYLTA